MNFKKEEGISLMLLVITVIVMVILAGSTISMVFDKEGILRTSEGIKKTQEDDAEQREENTNELMNELDQNMAQDYVDPSGANQPKLKSGMIPVKWDGSNWIVTDTKDSEWYNYNDKKWANIMLTDGLQVEDIPNASLASIDQMKGKKVTKVGSMFVWIPRYAYQIASGYHTNTAGKINVAFLKGTTSEPTRSVNIVEYNKTTTNNYTKFPDGYVVHPAFEYGEQISGIWVAKFKASRKDSTATNGGSDTTTLGVKPEVQCWVGLNMHEMYNKCIEYKPEFNSHLLKNNEWGAVAYLSHSNYGKNSEVWLNPGWTTGRSGISASTTNTTTYYSYNNTQYGVNASTTGNITGIYDVSGAIWEYVAGYVDNTFSKAGGERNSEEYGMSLIQGSNKTKNIYSSPTEENRSNNYDENKKIYGDAVYETSSTGDSCNSWYNDDSAFPYNVYLFFVRGGSNNLRN